MSVFLGRVAGWLRHESGDNIRQLWHGGSRFGECPVWDAGRSTIYWLDIPTGVLRSCAWPTGEVSEWPLGAPSAGLVLSADGRRLIFGQGIELHQFDTESGTISALYELPRGADGERINDLKLDPRGNLWVATMDSAAKLPTGRLMRRTTDGTWQLLVDGLSIFNGPAFSADGITGYVCDTLGRRILRFAVPDPASGNPVGTQLFATFAERDGFPDGICVDADAHLWVAHYAGGCVTRWSPDGQCVERLTMPAHHVTSIAESDHGLFITTAARDGKGEAKPDAGGALLFYDNSR